MNEKLEPCPFCGSEAGIPTNLDGTPVDYEITDCCCKNDDCPLADYWTPIKIWQTRPIEDEVRKSALPKLERDAICYSVLRRTSSLAKIQSFANICVR